MIYTAMINIWFLEKDSENLEIRWSTELDQKKVVGVLERIVKKLKIEDQKPELKHRVEEQT